MRTLHRTTLTALLAVPPVAHPPRLDGTPPKEEKKADPAPSDKREMTAEQWEAHRRGELAKDTLEAMTNRVIKLEADNHALRQRQAPDGGVVLDAEQRKRWEAWEKLGKPEDVSKSLEQATKDRAFVEQAEKAEEFAKVASAAGWDPETFAELNGLTPGLEWRVQEAGRGEDKVQQAQVKVGDEWKDADAFAEERWKKFLPVLQVGDRESKADPEPDQDTRTTRVATGGTGGGKGRTYTVEEAEKAKVQSGQYSM